MNFNFLQFNWENWASFVGDFGFLIFRKHFQKFAQSLIFTLFWEAPRATPRQLREQLRAKHTPLRSNGANAASKI